MDFINKKQEIVVEVRLPDESCRVCGSNLTKCAQCSHCKESISMICKLCGLRTVERFHFNCMFSSEFPFEKLSSRIFEEKSIDTRTMAN